jgi:hypothetical protein
MDEKTSPSALPDNRPWWQRLTRDSRPLPQSVHGRMTFYAEQVWKQRVGHYLIEGLIIAVSAAIPATAVMGASTSVVGLLGAVVTALVSIRQLLHSQEHWIRSATVLEALQGEAVAWSCGLPPYADGQVDATLAQKVEQMVFRETNQWAAWAQAAARGHRDQPPGAGTLPAQ